jgi:hypothetical protein
MDNCWRVWTAYVPPMRTFLLTAMLLAAAIGAAEARGGHGFVGMPPGSIGNAGRMPETMSPGALPPPPMISAPSERMPASYGARYPDTETFTHDNVTEQQHLGRVILR